MSTVFVGGSRHVSRLPEYAKERLANIAEQKFRIVVGDANGADKAVQEYLLTISYENVTVFCSGRECRNNLGSWEVKTVESDKQKGFAFYALKDREMALDADFGFMIWDGKSPGTMLNIFRLIAAGRKAVLVSIDQERVFNFKSQSDWDRFFSESDSSLRDAVTKRATKDELALLSADRQRALWSEPRTVHRKKASRRK